MNGIDVLIDGFGRVQEAVADAADGLDASALTHRVGHDANTIAWLLWHLTRVQDDHVADVAGTEQVWTAQGWSDRFRLPLPVDDTGFGHTRDEVASVRVDSAELLTGYHDAVYTQTVSYLERLTEEALDEVIDETWDLHGLGGALPGLGGLG
ncbi:mycothiol transferase, partial [Saccharomonospora saliphila]|uniref:mycothiol transferase n=1 Tax=Saccharomonospora saliphila TaxID=369829 RepID=UPI00037992B7